MEGFFGNGNEKLTFINTRNFLAILSTVSFSVFMEFIQHTTDIITSCYDLMYIFYTIYIYLEEGLAVLRTKHQCTRRSF